MNDLKQEGKLSSKNKGFVLASLTILLLGVTIFRTYFPALKNELSDLLFIAAFVFTLIGVLRERK